MTWQEFHERMGFMAEVIGGANENPKSAIDFSGERLKVERLRIVEVHGGAVQRQTVA